ncbi:hypothetical protein QOT17_001437 [Balamuthia mandrillaris]
MQDMAPAQDDGGGEEQGMTDEDILILFDQIDLNRDGVLNLDEFTNASIKFDMTKGEATFTFKLIDKHNTGQITLEQFRAFLLSVTRDSGGESGSEGARSRSGTGENRSRRSSSGNCDLGLNDGEGDLPLEVGGLEEELFTEEGLRALFNALDAGGNGKLNKEDLKKAFQIWGDDISDDLLNSEFSRADRSGKGFIDFEEFRALLCQQH